MILLWIVMTVAFIIALAMLRRATEMYRHAEDRAELFVGEFQTSQCRVRRLAGLLHKSREQCRNQRAHKQAYARCSEDLGIRHEDAELKNAALEGQVRALKSGLAYLRNNAEQRSIELARLDDRALDIAIKARDRLRKHRDRARIHKTLHEQSCEWYQAALSDSAVYLDRINKIRELTVV